MDLRKYNYAPVYVKIDMSLTEDTLDIILNELVNHHNYHYVVQIIDMLEFWGCDFKLVNHLSKNFHKSYFPKAFRLELGKYNCNEK